MAALNAVTLVLLVTIATPGKVESRETRYDTPSLKACRALAAKIVEGMPLNAQIQKIACVKQAHAPQSVLTWQARNGDDYLGPIV